MTEHQTETISAVAAKVAPPVTVSIATVMGVQVSDLVLWATLLYTVLMIAKTAFAFYRDIRMSTAKADL
jgi:hypothetical protein